MSESALPRTIGVRPALPHPTSRLVGRSAELRQLRGLLDSERLITLTGPPGSGKTRLAIEVAHVTVGAYEDGSWFAPLGPIEKPELIPHGVARAFGLKEEGDSPMREVVGRHLAERRLLLVLDNFEHVLGGAVIVAEWLAGAPRLTVVVTSRAALRLSGEREYVVPPLDVPRDPDAPAAADSAAVQLFNERARAAAPGFEPSVVTLPVVARICRRLDGLPLALELAAARAKALPPSAILERLEHSLELLTLAARDVPERHRSLHAAVSWSYGLLEPAERVFLRRLSVFRGGWSLESADAVTLASSELGAEPLDFTTTLLDESLITRQPDARTEARYDMLETLREYGLERLVEAGDADATADRHAAWLLDLAERAAPLLTGPDRGVWLDRLEREVHNFRAALRWTTHPGRVAIGMRLAAALWRFWQIRGHIGEGRQILAGLLEVEAEVDPLVRARALSAAGSLAYWQNDGRSALTLYEDSLELRRVWAEPAEVAGALFDLGHVLSALPQVQDSARGRKLEEEALSIYRDLGDAKGEAWLVWALGCNSFFAGDIGAGAASLAESVERFRGLDDPFGLGWALSMHGLVEAKLDRGTNVVPGWHEALRLFAEVDDVSGISAVLENLARDAARVSEPRRAVRLAAAAARIRGLSESLINYGGDAVGPSHERLTQAAIDEERRLGEAMTTAEAVAYALEGSAREAVPVLRVRALGSMDVELGGRRMTRWGGDKAGTRQAQAIFAFLFDRGPAGILKDEATELLWPDLEIKRADLAFHRTLGGLRSQLGAGREDFESITYEGGRYRIAPGLVTWSDVESFEALATKAGQQVAADAIATLEEARALYRGDLFDDCPFYGDSSFVEARRAYLRGRYEDVLIDLGDRYRELLDTTSAAACYRQATSINPDGRRASERLSRLGAAGEAAGARSA